MRLPIAPVVIGVAVLATAAAAQEPPRLAADDLNALPTAEVAAVLLQADIASTVIRHQATPPPVMSPPPRREFDVAEVRLYAAATGDEGVCWRNAYDAVAERAGEGFRPARPASPALRQVRLDGDCAGAVDRPFAYLNGAASEAEASRMLVRLGRLRDDARAGRALSVRVECSTDYSFYRCPARTLPLLADLPLEGAYMFSRSYDEAHALTLSATETTPGNLFWDIRFVDGETPVLSLKRRIPPPF